MSEDSLTRNSPEPQGGPTDPLELLVARCVERMASDGEEVLDVLCREHPEYADGLRRRMQLLRGIGLLADTPVQAFPERLGDFELIDRLGAGGMGVVYRARQVSLSREVALKLIRPEHLYFPGARERFRREVEAVARLQHPGIVPVYTVGEENGIPFFAMEHLRGAALSTIVASLTTRAPASLTAADLRAALGTTATSSPIFDGSWSDACLHLTREVAEALDHAHSRGVLHRDIKPSNVLVVPSGRAVVVDFGLASLHGADGITKSGSQPGSLPYMSPEQVRGESTLDARSDVYSLGVMLYELLTLHSPFLAASTEATRLRILQGEFAPIRSRNRAVTWEVETVCATAMEHEPARRYASMADFARDLGNLLARRPIEARRAGAWLRAVRFAQRHPVASMASAVSLVLLSTISIAFAYYQGGIASERSKLLEAAVSARALADLRETEARDKAAIAAREARIASQATGFLTALFQSPNPSRSHGETVTALEILRAGVARISTDLAEAPEVQIELLHSIGDALTGLGLYDEAIPLLENRLALARKLYEGDDPATADSLLGLAIALSSAQESNRAEQLLLESVAMRRRMAPAGDLETSSALQWLGSIYTGMNELDAARLVLEEAVALARRYGNSSGPELIAGLKSLGDYWEKRGDAAKSEACLRDALAASRRSLPGDHPWTAGILDSLVMLLNHQNRLAEATQFASDSLEIRRKIYKGDHGDLATAINNLGKMYEYQGEYDRALSLLEESVAMHRRLYGSNHQLYGRSLTCLADVLLEQGQSAAATDTYREALQILRTTTPVDESTIAVTLNNLANCLRRQGDLESPEALYREALQINRTLLGPSHVTVGECLYGLGSLLVERGSPEAALPEMLDALEVLSAVLPPDHPSIAKATVRLGRCRHQLGQEQVAEALLLEGYQSLVEVLGANHVDTRRTVQILIDFYKSLGRAEEVASYEEMLRDPP